MAGTVGPRASGGRLERLLERRGVASVLLCAREQASAPSGAADAAETLRGAARHSSLVRGVEARRLGRQPQAPGGADGDGDGDHAEDKAGEPAQGESSGTSGPTDKQLNAVDMEHQDQLKRARAVINSTRDNKRESREQIMRRLFMGPMIKAFNHWVSIAQEGKELRVKLSKATLLFSQKELVMAFLFWRDKVRRGATYWKRLKYTYATFKKESRARQAPLRLARAVRTGDVASARAACGSGADVNQPLPGSAGDCALHLAVRKNSLAMVEAMVGAGASFLVRNKQGVTPADLAAREGLVVEFLLERKLLPQLSFLDGASLGTHGPENVKLLGLQEKMQRRRLRAVDDVGNTADNAPFVA